MSVTSNKSVDQNSIKIAEAKSALHTQWVDSINKLRETGAHSDCTLMVGGEQLKAHRLILSAISPTFERMFGNEGCQEARDGIVRIEDPPGMLKDSTAKPFQYKALLSYAYTGCVDWTIYGDCKRDVLTVACKYFVFDLKHHVELQLARETGAHSDCTLMVGGEQLKAHRLILSEISPIFERMFGNEGCQEARDGIVRIEDPPGMLKDSTAKPFQYKALLSYAYTGCVDWTIYGDCKRDVLTVACKYFVFDLKHHVELQLVREITAESFTELLLLADTYSCDQLKKACVQFFSSNCRAVVLTPEWDTLTKTRVELTSELLRLVREGKTAASTTGAADGGGTK